MAQAIVLGAGMIGSVIATDLAVRSPRLDVTVADSRPGALRRTAASVKAAAGGAGGEIKTVVVDLADAAAIKRLVAGADVVCGAVASGIAYSVLRAVMESGKLYSDISFMGEDADSLDAVAKEHGGCAVVDIGVAPGMSHVLAADCHRRLAAAGVKTESLRIYVGGLPRVRTWPYQYKAAFSPADVLEEYTRPSRIVEHGKIVVREALSEPELMDFAGVGTLEAFNTDGLRSLSRTYLGVVPHMVEKTLRYPGHIEQMRVLRATGLMSEEATEVGGVHIKPRELLAKLMFPHWQYAPGEQDLTVMRVVGEGGGKSAAWDVLDIGTQGDGADGKQTSMGRTTGFPCAVVARMLLDGTLKKAGLGAGVINPERLGEHAGVVDALVAAQADQGRGICYRLASS
ncbi:MAG: saccharopine dehydrogenase C-terminal domain-containing protein [Phycisphaerales bacterium]|nr:saccharopine dehydrogenase C-terminal domain-containing protein [Phycisphaerales bacterium]